MTGRLKGIPEDYGSRMLELAESLMQYQRYLEDYEYEMLAVLRDKLHEHLGNSPAVGDGKDFGRAEGQLGHARGAVFPSVPGKTGMLGNPLTPLHCKGKFLE